MLTLRVALRYLISRKNHSAVNVISLISMTGVAVATMAVVCVLSVFNGFTELAKSKISQLSPDLRIESREGKVIHGADSLTSIIRRLPEVATAAPTIEEHALAIYSGRQMPVVMKGVTEAYDTITEIRPIVKDDGTWILSDSIYGDFATLSVGVAITLEAHPGFYRSLDLYVPRRTGRINPANPAASFRSDSLLVGGVFQTEQAEFDTDLILLPLAATRRMLDYTDEATAIEVSLAPGISDSKGAKALRQMLGDNFYVKDRIHQQEQSFKMISIEKWITFFLLAFILIIASFNVISTLSMLIIEKDDNIHTLYALGASRGMISRIFILEGWLISLSGGIIGIIAGVALSLAQQWGGFIKLGGDHAAMTIDAYPVKVAIPDLIAVIALVALVGWLTSALTAIIMRQRLHK